MAPQLEKLKIITNYLQKQRVKEVGAHLGFANFVDASQGIMELPNSTSLHYIRKSFIYTPHNLNCVYIQPSSDNKPFEF